MTEEKTDCRTLLKERGVCTVIPTYNNAATLKKVVEDVLEYCGDVIVVNDGSTDGTAEILEGIEGITVVGHEANRGKGHALKTGFRKALELGFAYAITLDSDGQHYAKDIEVFLRANVETPGALIIGERQLDGADMTRGSVFANKFSNFWFAVQTGKALKDTQTGYRLYPLRKLRGLNMLTSRYEAELELLVFAAWNGVRIVSVPVDVFYPSKEERVSHFRPVKDFARISVLNIALCVLALVYGLPKAVWRTLMTAVRTVYSFLVFILYCFLYAVPVTWVYTRTVRSKDRQKAFIHKMIHRFSRFVVIRHGVPGTKYSCKMEDASALDRPCMMICNHQSHLDLVCLLSLNPNIVCVTNEWAWNNPFYGPVIRKAGYIASIEDIDSMVPKAREQVEGGCSILAFPEGTRSKDGRIARFHKGAFYMAAKLGLDVLPVYLYGTGRILRKGSRHLNRGRMYLEVGKPLTRAELDAMGELRDQARIVRKMFTEKYESIRNRQDQYA